MLTLTFQRDEEKKTVNGTGFFVADHRTANSSAFLVNNRHNLDLGCGSTDKAKKYLNFQLTKIVCSGRMVNDDINVFEIRNPSPKFDHDYRHDVGIVSLAHVSNVNISYSHQVPFLIDLFVRFSDIAKDEEFGSTIELCDQVASPGYHEWLSEHDERPTFRIGWFVSDLSKPISYPEVSGDAFIIDGFSTEEVSGAPVFALPRGIKVGEGMVGGNYRPFRLVGVNAGHFKSPEYKHANLSYGFKSSVIISILKSNFDASLLLGL